MKLQVIQYLSYIYSFAARLLYSSNLNISSSPSRNIISCIEMSEVFIREILHHIYKHILHSNKKRTIGICLNQGERQLLSMYENYLIIYCVKKNYWISSLLSCFTYLTLLMEHTLQYISGISCLSSGSSISTMANSLV